MLDPVMVFLLFEEFDLVCGLGFRGAGRLLLDDLFMDERPLDPPPSLLGRERAGNSGTRMAQPSRATMSFVSVGMMK